LYPATLLNLFISIKSFLVEALGFSAYRIISSTNRDDLTSFCPIGMHFVSFSSLIALARISRIMLNKSGESRHLYYFLLDLFWLTVSEVQSMFNWLHCS
jgi:hypothetical protein